MRLFFAQAQLGLLTSFLHTFAVLGLGLSWMLVIWDMRSRGQDSEAFRFWLRVFALTAYGALALGVMAMVQTGLVFPLTIERMGNVLGPILLAVVLTAFVIKSTVFGVVLYSRHRVTPGVFRLCLLFTALGLTAVVAGMAIIESWMRAPTGAVLLDGQFRIHDWLAINGNPQLSIQLVFAGVTTALMLSSVLVSVWALQLFSNPHARQSSAVVRGSAWAGLLCTIAVLPLCQEIIEQAPGQSLDLITVLSGEVMVSSLDIALTQVSRLLLLVWPLHFLVLVIALSLMYVRGTTVVSSLAVRIVAIGAITGPAICLVLWWLLYLGKGSDMVVGQVTFGELVSPVPAQYLFLGLLVCFVLVAIVLVGWMRLTYQALSDGVVTVHRPGVVLS